MNISTIIRIVPRLTVPCWIVASIPLLAGASRAAETAASWPQFRGPTGMGVSSAKGLPTTWSEDENIVWKAQLPVSGSSSPVVVGERIFLTGFRGFGAPGEPGGEMDSLERLVVCLDSRDGKILWSEKLDSKLPDQDRIRENHGYASSTPVADDARLFVFFGKSGVFALDFQGKRSWHADVGSGLHGWGSANSLALHKDLVLVNASMESESLVALDKLSGKEVWRAKGIKESWNLPLVVSTGKEKAEIVLAIMGKVLGFDPATGNQLWSCDTGIGWYMVPSLVIDGDVIYCIGGRSGGALAVRAGGRGDVTGTHRVWTGRKGSNVSSPILHSGHLYWMHENLGIAYCAEAKTGTIVYEERLKGADQVYASPVLADGKIYYLTRGGTTIVLAARPQLEQLASNRLAARGQYNASPAVAGSRLLIRCDKALYCIGQK